MKFLLTVARPWDDYTATEYYQVDVDDGHARYLREEVEDLDIEYLAVKIDAKLVIPSEELLSQLDENDGALLLEEDLPGSLPLNSQWFAHLLIYSAGSLVVQIFPASGPVLESQSFSINYDVACTKCGKVVDGYSTAVWGDSRRKPFCSATCAAEQWEKDWVATYGGGAK